ncbi:uncharacterized protein ISCGN_023405 [Ixodes scapularis]
MFIPGSSTVLWGLRSLEKTSALVGGLQQSPDTEVFRNKHRRTFLEKESVLGASVPMEPAVDMSLIISVKANLCGSLSHRCFPHWMTFELLPRKPRNRPVTARALRLRKRNQGQRSHRMQGGSSEALGECIRVRDFCKSGGG